MIAIRPSTSSSSSTKSSTANILPCRFQHTGPAKITKRFWDPVIAPSSSSANSTATVHFRGRRLRGRVVRLPEQYVGLVLKDAQRRLSTAAFASAEARKTGGLAGTSNNNPRQSRSEEDDVLLEDEEEGEKEEEEQETKVFECESLFDELMVWGHDRSPAADDVYVKGVDEWIGFAEAVNS